MYAGILILVCLPHISRYFSANYAIVVALLGIYSLITNPLLLISLAFLVGGFLAINRFGKSLRLLSNRGVFLSVADHMLCSP